MSKQYKQIRLYNFYKEKESHLALLHIAVLMQGGFKFPIYIECTRREARQLKRQTKRWLDFKRMPRHMKLVRTSRDCDTLIYDIEKANNCFGIFEEIYKRYYKETDNKNV